jgi:hypothetical protein
MISPNLPHVRRFVGLLMMLVVAAAPQRSQAESINSADEQVLFSFDDVSIPWRDNLKLTLEKPKKYSGNPVMPAGPQGSPDGNGCLLYGTVFEDGGKLRMWYVAWPQVDARYPQQANRYYRPIAYAESTDGIHWQKPNLGLVDFSGNKNNNLVSIEPANHPFAVANDYVSVLHDVDDPDPARRYKMVYISYLPALRHSGAVTATSPDGLNWKLASTDEFTKGHFEMTSLVKFDGLYYVAGQNLGRSGGHHADGLDAGRTMTGFFSPDFKHWSSGRALSFVRNNYQPNLESFGQELHMGAGLWNRGNVIVGLCGRWHGDTVNRDPEMRKITPVYDLEIDLGLVVSNDAIHYREPIEEFAMVSPGKADEWDSHALLQGQAYHNTPTETHIWYSSWYTPAPFPLPAVPGPRSKKPPQVGLLTMRRDGFGFLSKHRTKLAAQPGFYRTDTGASILTKSLQLEHGGKLLVNVDGVTSDAPLSIAIVDDAEQPLAGIPVATVGESGVRVPVSFGGKNLPAGKKFRVRVEWPEAEADNPRFYAMYLQP